MDERIAIFIDGSNFYHGLKENIGISKINFQKFVELLVGQRDLLRTYYYNATLSTNEGERYKDQQRFFAYLRTIPNFTVRLGRLEKREGAPPEEKGVDVAIATDMLEMAYENAYDTCILVSGDGDFAYVIEAVKRKGKHVENAYFWPRKNRQARHCASWHLRQVCDKFIFLNSQFLKCCF